jgi:hypothetical protein
MVEAGISSGLGGGVKPGGRRSDGDATELHARRGPQTAADFILMTCLWKITQIRLSPIFRPPFSPFPSSANDAKWANSKEAQFE